MSVWFYLAGAATLGATIALLIIIVAAREERRDHASRPSPGWPADLARLAISERPLAIDTPLSLCGKPDEVYLNHHGLLVPVETKTRGAPKVYLSDKIQLSVYAIVLRYVQDRRLPHGPGRPVADYGYVRIVTPGGVKWQRVALLTLAQVAGLVRRRIALEKGAAEPRGARHPGICRDCAFRHTCPKRR